MVVIRVLLNLNNSKDKSIMFFKNKYQFNQETLSYDKIELTIKEKMLRALVVLAAFFSTVALITFIVFSYFIDSASYIKYQKEKRLLLSQYEQVNDQLDELNAVIVSLQQRDDSIYRLALNAEPLPTEIRTAGIGGSDKYANLRQLDNAEIVVQTAERIDRMQRMVEVQSESYNQIMVLALENAERMAHIPALLPVPKGQHHISSYFGPRLHPILKIRRMHEGIDLSAPRGTPVYATGNGVVDEAKYSGGFGKQIYINHGFGYKSRYAHLSRMAVRTGQKVKRGDIIGYVGSTGLSSSSHLHYEVHKDGRPVNPLNYYYSDISPEEYAQLIRVSRQQEQ